MKKMIFLALGAAALYQAAKYFKIESWADLSKLAVDKFGSLKNMTYAKAN